MHLTKHHGLGNDFLVVMDLDQRFDVDPALARALCDRQTGLGADGLIRVTAGTDGAAVTMRLWNADGSVAEMSGNGIRCLAQAVVGADVVTERAFVVATDGGRRHVEMVDDDPIRATVAVGMGPAASGPALDGVMHPTPVEKARSVSMGNPHVVLLIDDPLSIDHIADGTSYQTQFPRTGGINVEWIRPVDGGIDMVVFERGVGVTRACGTGACAAAHAAHLWGLTGERVDVAMPGGRVIVELGAEVTLIGPVNRVASMEIDPADLLEPAAPTRMTA